MWPNPQETAGLVIFTEEILNGKTSFFVRWIWYVFTNFSIFFFIKKPWKSFGYTFTLFQTRCYIRECRLLLFLFKLISTNPTKGLINVLNAFKVNNKTKINTSWYINSQLGTNEHIKPLFLLPTVHT